MSTYLAVNEITGCVDFTTQANSENDAILSLQGELRELINDDLTIFILSSRTQDDKMLFEIIDDEFSGTYHFEKSK